MYVLAASTPVQRTGRRLRSSHPAVSAFPEIAVGSACTSSFSRLARRLLALRPAHSRRHLYVTSHTEGFSHFVTSMTAPVASGWSVRRGGTCTHWKAPPSHGARRVEVWRGGVRLSMSVSAPFVWRCLSGSAVAPFPHPLIEPDMQISRIRLSDKTSRRLRVQRRLQFLNAVRS